MKDITSITNLEIKILSMFTRNYNLKISILQLSKQLKVHYPNVYKTVKKLENKGLLKLETIGKASICALNKNTLNLSVYLAYVEEDKAKEVIKKYPFIGRITKEIIKINPISVIGIFGSHIIGKTTLKSDIDLFILTDKIKELKDFIPKYFPEYENKIDFNVISFEEFTESIKNIKQLTVSTEIIKNKMLISGAEVYYNILLQNEIR